MKSILTNIQQKHVSIVKYSSIVALLLYFLQGVAYPASSFVGKITVGVYLLLGFYCLLRTIITKSGNNIVYFSIGFIIINLAYFGYTSDIEIRNFYSLSATNVIKNICLVFSTIGIFHFLSINKAICRRTMLYIFGFYFVIGIINFFELSPFCIQTTKNVNNIGYAFINILPFLFLFKKKWLALIFAFLCGILVFYSLKRGAMLILLVFFAFYIFAIIKDLRLGTKKNIAFFVLTIMLAVATFLIFYNINAEIALRVDQTISGYSSGRDHLYGGLWSNWKESNSLTTMLFGNGFAYTPYITGGRYAHNDWLELLTTLGLFGTSLYLAFYTILAKFAVNAEDKIIRRTVISIIIILLLKSLFSMAYFDIGTVPEMIVLGYLLGENDQLQKEHIQ